MSILAKDRINQPACDGGPPGAGAFIKFAIGKNEYAILGKRFGKKWKWTVGGAMEPGEKNINTILREVEEEHFFFPHTMPINYEHNLTKFCFYNKKHNYTTFMFDNNYFSTIEQLNETINEMNNYAKLACSVRQMLLNEISFDKSIVESFLKLFIKHLKPETQFYLTNYSGEKNCPEEIIKDVSNYTEYSEFSMITVQELKEKVNQGDKTFFGGDKKALDALL